MKKKEIAWQIVISSKFCGFRHNAYCAIIYEIDKNELPIINKCSWEYCPFSIFGTRKEETND